MYPHEVGEAEDGGNRRDVGEEIEIEAVGKRRIDRARRGDPEQRIAIRRCTYDCLDSDVRAGTRPVVNDELLAKTGCQPLAHQRCVISGETPAAKATNDRPRPYRMALAVANPLRA